MGLKKSHSDGNGSISHVAAPSGDEDQANFVMGQIKKVICPWGISKDKLMKSLDSCWLACGLSQGNTADDLPKGEVDQKDERSRGEKTFQKVDTNSSDHGKKRKRDETDDCFQEDEAEVDHTSGGMIPNEHTSPESTVGGKFRNRNEPKGVTESVKLQKMSQTMEREQCGKSPDGDRFGDSLNKIPWITQDSSSSRLPTPSLAVDQPPSSTVPPPLFSNQCSSRSVPLPTPSPSPSWPRQTGSLERVTQHARANKVVQTSNKVSLAHVRLGGCTSSGKNFLLPDDAVNNRSKSAHFPRVGDILEAGFYRASSACIHCKRKGIICTFGTGISKSNKLRRPGLARCDYCPVIKRKCIFTTGVESVENKAQKVSDSMSIKPCLAMNGNVVTKPSHLLNGDRIMQIETNPSEPVGTLAKTSPRTWDVKEKSVKEAGKEVGKEAHRFLGSSAGGDGEEIKKNASKNLDSLAKKLSGALAGDGDAESQGEARKKSVFA
nr:uncharacterized protein BN887_02292 [Melanopsichium pennsylvanicum 4]